MKRLAMAVLILAALVLVSAPAFSKTVLTFWYSLPNKQSLFMEKLVQEYNASRTAIEIQPRNFATERELILALLMEGETPNIALIDSLWTYELVKRQKLAPIEDLMEKSGSMVRIMAKMDTFKPMIESCTIKGSDNSGILFTYPLFAQAYALIYNKDLLSTAGITSPPSNWGELVQYGKKVMAANPGAFGLYMPFGEGDWERGNFLRLMFWEGGSKIYDPLARQVFFNDAEGEKIVKFLMDLVGKYGIATFNREKPVAFKIGTVEEFLKLKLEGQHVGVAPLPYRSGKTTRSLTPLKISTLAVMKNPNPVMEQRSWNFVAFLREFPQVLFLTRFTPLLPAHKQVVRSPEYFELMKNNQGLEVYVNQIEQSPVEPPNLTSQKIVKVLSQELGKAFEGKCTPSEALQAAAIRITEILNNPAIPWTELY